MYKTWNVELKRSDARDVQELSNDKKVLEGQVYEHMNTISTLRSEVSQLKIGGSANPDDVNEQLQQLRQLLQDQQQQTEEREKQVRNIQSDD